MDEFINCFIGVLSFLLAVVLDGVLVPVDMTMGCALYVAFSTVDTSVYVPQCFVSLTTVSVSLFLRLT